MSHPDPMFDPENVINHKEVEVKSDQDMERPITVVVGSSEEPEEFDKLSACCGAPILMETFCSDCKEPCR